MTPTASVPATAPTVHRVNVDSTSVTVAVAMPTMTGVSVEVWDETAKVWWELGGLAREVVSAAAVTVSEAFDCLFQDQDDCNQKAYCNYTEVLGAMVCAPLLEDERLQNVIEQACTQQADQVRETVANLAEARGEDGKLASLNAAFALDFFCGKDELDEYYFPDRCPCE